jgi:acyl transferase domain-containing protein
MLVRFFLLTNPLIDTPWPKDKLERASINSFGIGGANAHVILESAASYGIDQFSNPFPISEPQLLLYSSNDQRSTNELVRQHEEYADSNPESAQGLAYTLAHRRDQKSYRAFSIRTNGLSALVSSPIKTKHTPKVVLVFTGQGAQWAQMGIDLLTRFQSFVQDIKTMQSALTNCPHPPSWSIMGWSLTTSII